MKLKDWFIQNADTIFTESYRLNLKDMPLCTEGDLHTYSSINTTQWLTNLCMSRKINWWPDHMCSTKVNNFEVNGYDSFYNEDYSRDSGSGTYMNSELGVCRIYENKYMCGYGYGADYFHLMTQNANGSFRLCEDNELGQLPILVSTGQRTFPNANYVHGYIGIILFVNLKYKRWGTQIQDRYRLIYCPFWNVSYDYNEMNYYNPIYIDLYDNTDGDHLLVLNSYYADSNPNAATSVDARVKVLLMYDQFNPATTYVPSPSYWSGSLEFGSNVGSYTGQVLFRNNINGWAGYDMTINCTNKFSCNVEGDFTVNLNFIFALKMAGRCSEQESRPII